MKVDYTPLAPVGLFMAALGQFESSEAADAAKVALELTYKQGFFDGFTKAREK